MTCETVVTCGTVVTIETVSLTLTSETIALALTSETCADEQDSLHISKILLVKMNTIVFKLVNANQQL